MGKNNSFAHDHSCSCRLTCSISHLFGEREREKGKERSEDYAEEPGTETEDDMRAAVRLCFPCFEKLCSLNGSNRAAGSILLSLVERHEVSE